MSQQKRDGNIPEIPIERNRFPDRSLSVRVYYLRIHDLNDNLTMRMKFDDGITFQFVQGRMNSINTFGPFIYAVDLNLLMNMDKLYVQDDSSLKLVHAFMLQMLYPVPVWGHCVHEEKDNGVHTLKDCFDKRYCFLFNIRFSSRFKLTARGRTLSSIQC